MLQAFRRDRRRNTAEFFFETAKGQDQSPPFVGNFGATAMRTAGAGDERRARQKIIDRVDRVPGGLVLNPVASAALVMLLCSITASSRAMRSRPIRSRPPARQASKLSISPRKLRATRSPKFRPMPGNWLPRLQYNSSFARYRAAFWHCPVARA
jgi:hypothetical protein